MGFSLLCVAVFENAYPISGGVNRYRGKNA
jgi:hypothetical protein